LSQFRVVRLGNIFVCTVVLSTLALAADQKSPTKLSDLPPDAQRAISAALARNSVEVEDFTLTASDGVDGDDFGASVAIDGNTVVVGALSKTVNGNQEQGSAYVFVKPANGWANMTQTAELTALDGQTYDELGCSVGISGNTVVAGACNATINGNPYQGAAYVFVEPAGGWTNMTETAKLTASDGSPYAYFGAAAAISGSTVVVGSPFGTIDNPEPGKAYVFEQASTGWTTMTQTAELTPSDGAVNDDFGYAVSVDSNTVIVVGASVIPVPEPRMFSWNQTMAGWIRRKLHNSRPPMGELLEQVLVHRFQ
jgi:hypothetical protein